MSRVYVFNRVEHVESAIHVTAASWSEARRLIDTTLPGDSRVHVSDPNVSTYRVRFVRRHIEGATIPVASPPIPAVGEDQIEAMARIIDPPSWAAYDRDVSRPGSVTWSVGLDITKSMVRARQIAALAARTREQGGGS